MNQNIWIELEQTIEDQLKLQVDLSLERHHNFMLKHGLSDCQKVMDIGTGNGLFISKVAEEHPQIQFHGIDNKPHMVEKAKSRNLPNCSWSLGDALDQNTRIALSTINGILMRYFVLHMPNTREAFLQICKTVQNGTKLWIFDLDLDHYICKPDQPEFILIRDIVETFCDQHSVEIRVGTKLPPILEEVGFKVTDIEFEPFNNQEIDHQRFAEYVFREASLYNHFLGNDPDSEEMERIENFLFNVMDQNKHFVQYGMVMISAEKV